MAVLTAVAVTTAGLLAGVTFAAPSAFATTSNPTPSAGARKGATRLPFSISGTSSLSVDVGTGNASVTDQLLTLPGVRSDVPVTLFYNSSVAGTSTPSAVTGSNGSGWGITGFDERMVTNADNSVTFYGPGGLSGVFAPNGSGFTSPAQFQAMLSGTSSAYTLTYHVSQEKLVFDGSGRLHTDTDRDGNVTTFNYDSYETPTSIVSSRGPVAGRTVTVGMSGSRIATLTQTSGSLTRTVQFTYTAGGNLRAVIDTTGGYTQFYSASGTDTATVASITNPYNVATRLGYSSGKVSSVAQDNPAADGGAGTSSTRLTYPSSTQTLVADPITDQGQAVSAVPHTTYTINAANLVSSVQDANGNSRSATYTPLGDTASTTNAAGGASSFTYGKNSGESLTAATNPGGATESAGYTNTGASAYLPSSSTDDASNALTNTYDTNGNQTGSSQGASGPQAKVTYSGDGTPATSASPGAAAGVTTSYAYANGDGDLTKITPPAVSSLAARVYTWDGYGRLKSATDGAGDTITYYYDGLDRIGKLVYSDGTASVVYTYNKNGHPTQRVDASGTTTSTYDDLGHLLTVKNTANNNLITYTYDLDGQLSTVTDGLGTTTYSYDNAHQLVKMSYPQIGTTGNLNAYFANNGDNKRTDVWLQANNLNAYNVPQTWAAHEHFAYDSSGRITTVLGENGPATAPTTVENETVCHTAGTTPGASCPAATGSGPTSTDRSNVQWTSETVSGENNAYTYDDHNRLTKDIVTGGSNPRTYTYGYDAAGNRTSSTLTGTSPSSQSLAYNDGNQIKTTGYTYDGAGNLTSSPTRSATFNAAGQQKTATVSGVTSTYTYAGTNSDEMLTEAIPNDHTYTLTYGRADANGLPVVDSVNVAGIGTGYVLTDPSGQPIMLGVSSGNTCLYLYDGIHNPVGLSNSNQTTSQAFRYDPYGGVTTTNNSGYSSSYQNPYTFGEGIRDRATGEVKFGQRFYNPTTGNWTQQDTLNAPLDPGNANRYQYAADNPINISDAQGRNVFGDFAAHIAGAALGAVSGASLGTQIGFFAGEVIDPFGGGAPGALIGGAVGSVFGAAYGAAGGGGLTNYAPK